MSVIVITGLTNAGKTTLGKFLYNKGYTTIVEYTTRPARAGETNHEDYHFIDDDSFDKMESAGEFAETLHVSTMLGVWKYGAKKADLADDKLLLCGPHQMKQMLDAGIPMLSVLLDIDKKTAMERMKARGFTVDSEAEFDRRFQADEQAAHMLRDRVTMILDAKDSIEVNAQKIDDCYLFRNISTAQKMSDADKRFYLDKDTGLIPYLRMREKGMPKGKIEQIAWLLLSGGGCAFCKVCRDEPCNIKDGEKCTANIADYIRKCVYEER